MSNNNIVIKLHDSLSKATAQKLYPTDIAFLLGYGSTQIKDYFKLAKKGKISKPNKRLERAALLAYRLGKVEGFESLFPLIPKLSGDLDDAEWMNRTGRRMDKMLRVDQSIAGQLDLIEESKKPENDDQKSLILWPEFVSSSTREALKGFDAQQIEWALSFKGEKVVSRLLAGFVKEAAQHG